MVSHWDFCPGRERTKSLQLRVDLATVDLPDICFAPQNVADSRLQPGSEGGIEVLRLGQCKST